METTGVEKVSTKKNHTGKDGRYGNSFINIFIQTVISIHMKVFHVFCLFVILGITTFGAVQAVTIGSTPVTKDTLATLSNEQPDVNLSMEPGVYLISFQAFEPQRMSYSQATKDASVGSSELIIDSPYNGSVAFGIYKPNECTINITSTGTWAAQVTRYDMTNPVTAPVNLSGTGTTVSEPFTPEKGEYFFQRGQTQAESPMYFLSYSNGSYVMDDTNSYVLPGFSRISTEKFKILNIPESGTYYLNALSMEKNPMAWNVSISSVPPAPVMGPGPAIRNTE